MAPFLIAARLMVLPNRANMIARLLTLIRDFLSYAHLLIYNF